MDLVVDLERSGAGGQLLKRDLQVRLVVKEFLLEGVDAVRRPMNHNGNVGTVDRLATDATVERRPASPEPVTHPQTGSVKVRPDAAISVNRLAGAKRGPSRR